MTSFVKVTLEMIEDDVSSTIDELLSSKIKKVVSKSLVELGGKIARNAKTKQYNEKKYYGFTPLGKVYY